MTLEFDRHPNWSNSIRHLTSRSKWANNADIIADVIQWKKATFETAHLNI